MIRRLILVVAFTLAVVAPGRSQSSEPVYPTLTQPVTDTAGVIDAESAATLDQHLRALRAATNDVMAIVTVPTIEPAASIETYAVKLFERAGIGNRALDNGILILVAVKEHGIRIEVGYGLEGIVTDGFAGDTIRQLIVPEFKAGRYGAGLVAGSTRLIQQISEGRKTEVAGIPPKPVDTASVWPMLIVGLVGAGVVIGLFVVLGRRRPRGATATGAVSSAAGTTMAAASTTDDDWRRHTSATFSSDDSSSSSDSSSDSGGFDGGSSGGGGASGSW